MTTTTETTPNDHPSGDSTQENSDRDTGSSAGSRNSTNDNYMTSRSGTATTDRFEESCTQLREPLLDL